MHLSRAIPSLPMRALQDEEERELAITLLASQGEKKTRSDRRKEAKDRKEAKRAGGQASLCVCWVGGGGG